MAVRLKRPRPYRLLIVTFDLTDTVPGDPRYRAADAALAFHGDLFRPVKQLRLLITKSTSRRVKASVEQRIGKRATIFVAPITSVPAWRIHGVQKRREWRHFVQALRDRSVTVDYVSDDPDSAE